MHPTAEDPVRSLLGSESRGRPGFRVLIDGPGYEGFVVVDSIVDGRSSGGLRVTDDLAVEEVAALAQEMSHKYALFHLPRGGAKAGLRLADDLDPASRQEAFLDFGRKLAPVIRNGIYSPGMDMNCGPDELRAIYQGAGIGLGELTDTSWYTALTVHHSLRAMSAHLSITGRPVTLAIEGFGRVARHLADRLDPSEFRVVALATIEGGLRAKQAFDPAELVRAKDELGDALVGELAGETIPPAEVLTSEADIVLPSSRTWVVTPEVADAMDTRAVVPISNVPYAGDAVARLHRRGVALLPGFVSNVGGVLASSLHDLGIADDEVETLLGRWYRPIVDGILRLSAARGVPAVEIATELATTHAEERPPFRHRSLVRRVHERFVRPRLPQSWKAREAREAFVERSRRILEEIDQREREA